MNEIILLMISSIILLSLNLKEEIIKYKAKSIIKDHYFHGFCYIFIILLY